MGCFAYSPVEGASANALAGALPDALREARKDQLMHVQSTISEQRIARRVGSLQRVLIDTVDRTGAVGRSSADAPQIDGVVKVAAHRSLKSGEFAMVRILASDAYDLHGVVETSSDR